MGLFNSKSKNNTNDIPVVCDVDLERYLGKWYEIARFPHSFEEGLENVTATYRLKKHGKINVLNAGFKNGKRSEANGTAWIPDSSCAGNLLVSFFGPFRSKYKIIKLDKEHYNYAVITSSSKKYLWILSREPNISEGLYEELISFASSAGFDVSKTIKVVQNHIEGTGYEN